MNDPLVDNIADTLRYIETKIGRQLSPLELAALTQAARRVDSTLDRIPLALGIAPQQRGA